MSVYALPLLALALQAEAGGPQDLRALFAEAVRLQQARDFDASAAAYARFLEAQPRNVEALSNLGAVLSAQGRYEEAIARYRAALALAPSRTAVRQNLAVALLKAGRPAEAAPELKRVMQEAPGERPPTMLLAECRARLGDYAAAAALLSPLVDQNPEDRAAAYLLGLALVQSKQGERGQRLLDRVLRDGDSAQARLLLGVVKLLAGDYAEAKIDLRRAAELDPKLPQAHYHLGKALMDTGDVGAAAEAFLLELQTNPNDFDTNLMLGVLRKQDQRLEEAMAHYRKAAAVRPDDPAALYQIGALELQLGRTEEAQAVLERVVAAAPEFGEAHVSLATAYYRLKRREDGDRHRALARELARQEQEKQPGAQPGGEAYRGEPATASGPVEKPRPEPPVVPPRPW